MRSAFSRKRAAQSPCSQAAKTKVNGTETIPSPISDIETLILQQQVSESRLYIRRSDSLIIKFRVIMQKICGGKGYSSTSDKNSEVGRRSGLIKSLLQDIVGGIILGTFGMGMLLLMDYYSIINLETARVFRKTAAHVFNTPEIRQQLEEEMVGKKLLPIHEYNTRTKELSDTKAVYENEKRLFDIRSTKATTLKGELAKQRVEYDKLIKETGLEHWCAECLWGMGFNCQGRVNHMLEKYSDTATTIECIAKLVSQGKTNGKCVNPNK